MLALPRAVYRAGAGAVLGHRFLLLVHRGRRTGRLHETVLEVLRWRGDAREAVVISGFGQRAQWLQNVLAGGTVEVRIAHERWTAVARHLEPVEAVAVLAEYERRNPLLRPVVHRLLSRLAGFRYDGSPATADAVVRALPLVAFRPAAPASPE
jgi:deazaflavin-dependent oxidoreductase (nitroreductase family)